MQEHGGEQVAPGLDSAQQVPEVGIAAPIQNFGHEFGRAFLGAHRADGFALRNLGHGFILVFDEIHVGHVDHIQGTRPFDFKPSEFGRVTHVEQQEVLVAGN